MMNRAGAAEYDEYISAYNRSSNTFSQDERTVVNVSNSQNEGLHPMTTSRRLCIVLFVSVATALLIGGMIGGFFLFEWLVVEEEQVVTVVGRKEWGARPPRVTFPLPEPPATHLLISHTYSPPCHTPSQCKNQIRHFQNIDMDAFRSEDIWYNFLVGGDGKIYEGRGWDVQPMASNIVRSCSMSLAFIGNFSTKVPPTQQLVAALELIDLSLYLGKLSKPYTMIGHHQVATYQNPGPVLFKLIQKWPQWKNCSMEGCICSALKSRNDMFDKFN